jgi:amicyanin
MDIEGFDFSPGSLRIDVGDTVTWTNRDGVGHTVTSDDGVFNSGTLFQNQTFTFIFDAVGSYPYHCTPHPFMRDTVTVEDIIGIGDDPAPTPTGFEISQNYPNPFNASTTIAYYIPRAGRVRVEICNLLGQLIATLADEISSAGQYEVIWNAGQRESGVFFYRVFYDGQVKTGRMVMLK